MAQAWIPSPYDSSNMGGSSTDWDQLLGGLGQMAGGLFGRYNNPADASMEYANKLSGVITPYYDPYMDAGLAALGILGPEYSKLISDPAAMMAFLGEGFEQSPGYQYQYDTAMNAANTAAAAGGQLGGTAHQENAAKQATNLANQDYYNSLNNTTGLYKTGLSGMGDINQMGYMAASDLAGYLAQNIMNQAMIAAMSAKQQNSSAGGIFGGAVDMVSSIF